MTIIRRESKRGVRYAVKVYRGGRQVWIGTYEKLGRIDEPGTARWAEAQALMDTSLGDVTCDEFCDRWLEQYPRGSAATMRTYQYAIQQFKQDFAGVPLRKIDRPTVRRWSLDKPKSQIRVLRAMFSDARNDGLINENPFTNLRRETRSRKPEWIPTPQDVYELADCALGVHGDYGPMFRGMILFAAFTGMRPGEIFPLEWADVDFARQEVHVTKSLDGTGRLNPRTKNGLTRTILLPPPAADALTSFHRTSDRLVFTTKTGRMFTRPQLNLYWNPVRAAYGRPRMRFYDLRHACATMLLEMGLPPHDVAVQLGHTDGGALVMNTYGHPERSALNRLKSVWDTDVTPLNPSARLGRIGGSS